RTRTTGGRWPTKSFPCWPCPTTATPTTVRSGGPDHTRPGRRRHRSARGTPALLAVLRPTTRQRGHHHPDRTPLAALDRPPGHVVRRGRRGRRDRQGGRVRARPT